MKILGFYDGKYDLIENMVIPFDDRVHYYGDGVYDATCAGNHVIFNLEEHIDRFYNSASLLGMVIPYSKEELKDLLNNMVQKVEGEELFVYWQVTRGVAPRKHEFPQTSAHVWIMIRPSSIGNPDQALKLLSIPDTRFLHCNIKTLNLIPNVLASQKGKEAGCDEIIFHRDGIVTECSHSNISIIKNGKFITHPTDCYILPGIARAHLIKMCARLEISVEEREYTLEELMNADEIIVSSSSNFCLKVEEVDGIKVGGQAQELVKKLQDILMDEYLVAIGKK